MLRRRRVTEQIRPIRPGALVAAAAAVTVLGAVGVLPRWAGLLHMVALPPLDLIADLRVLMVVAPSPAVFAAGVAACLTVRITVLTLLLGGFDRRLLAYAARWYLVMLPLALVAAALPVGSGATLYYGLFWMGMIAALAAVAFTAAALWAAPPRLARGFAEAARHGFRLGTVGAYLVALALLGAVADLTRPVGPVALVPVSALLTLAAIRFLRADPGLRMARRTLAGAGAALAALLAAVMAAGPTSPPLAPEPATPRRGSLMLMSGVDSSSGNGAILEIDPHHLGYTCGQTYYFSYAGPGSGQPRNAALCPITTGAPYRPRHTLRPTDQLISGLAAQLTGLPPPVVLITHSQGVWITWEAALRHRLPQGAVLVLVGPFPDNPVPYPPQGQHGTGWPAAVVTWLISRLARPGGTSVFTPDAPLGREWLAHPTAIEKTLAGRLPPHMRALSVPSAFDTPLMPDGPTLKHAANLCPIPVIHPHVPYSAEFQRSVTRFLDHQPQPPCPLWRHAMGPVFRAFSAPSWDA